MSKVLVITGSEYSGWGTLTRYLSAEPDQNDFLNDALSALNQRLCAGEIPQDEAIKKAELLFAQLIEDGTAGWADHNASASLPFWASVRPDSHFLLVYSSPEYAFAHAIKSNDGNQDIVNEAMLNWERSCQTMLDFFQRNRDRCLLVNVSTAYHQAAQLASLCTKTFGKSIATSHNIEIDPALIVIESEAALLLNNYDQLHGLYDELQGAASLPGLDIGLTSISGDRKNAIAAAGIKEYLKQQQTLEKLASTRAQLEAENQNLQASNAKLAQAVEASRLEQELGLLQIHQLQEELEHYFISYQELQASSLDADRASSLHRSIEHASASHCDITGTSTENGYEHLELMLNGFELADGRKYDQLPCKLVLTAGLPGLEFRPGPDDIFANLLDWPRAMADEHGNCLLYLPSAVDELAQQQQAIMAQLSTTDRQLIFSATQVIADCLMTGKLEHSITLGPSQLRQWRLSAFELANQAQQTAPFLTMDSVGLNEEYRADGYEHLWLQCENLQFGQQRFANFNFKVASVNGSADSYLLLEFRELTDRCPPLQAWPPEETDAHGPKLRVMISTRGNKSILNPVESITDNDKAFILQLVQALPGILLRVEKNGVTLERGWPEWHQMTAKLATNHITYDTGRRGIKQRLKGLLRRIHAPKDK